MLDPKFVRDNIIKIKASETKRGHGTKFLEAFLKNDEFWRKSKAKNEKLKQKRNIVSREINHFKKQNKGVMTKIKDMRKVSDAIKLNERRVVEYFRRRNDALSKIGNILDPSVPKGKDDSQNVPLKHIGRRPNFNFQIKDHIELGKSLDLFEFDIASKVSGSRFYYLKNEAVILDMALQRYAVDKLIKSKFKMFWPPLMLNRAALSGGVNLSEFKDTIYKIDGSDLYLIGTSEHPLVALKKDQVIPEHELPMRIGGVSVCFRREAGSHGRDTKGIFRVHQFNKVEQVVYCTPEESPKFFKELQRNSEEMFKELGIPFRVVNICTGDLGNKQILQYDIEAWFPGQKNKKGAYREVTSCSNVTDYQAVTLNTKFLRKNSSEREYVHMLNNTALATSRVIVAILENFQQKDGSVIIPKALWKYTGFKIIKPK